MANEGQGLKKNLISKKKAVYSIRKPFHDYLVKYGRIYPEGVRYDDLLRFDNSIAQRDEMGKDTLWSTVFYAPIDMQEIYENLRITYAILYGHRDRSIIDHLDIDRVDMCLYGNTMPFRVRVINRVNDNIDYFYVKRTDANRVYGLELEHILSPNRLNFFIHENTIIEEHIVGIPADAFMREFMPQNKFDQVRLAKEFVKFNERCFVRLLGDMHSGNFVVDMTRDFEKWQFRMRAIDFDQQSYHWKKQVYLPQFYTQNNPMVKLGLNLLDVKSARQYQKEERALISQRLHSARIRLDHLLDVMLMDQISTEDNVRRLGEQLAEHYQSKAFLNCTRMGELLRASLDQLNPYQPDRMDWSYLR